MIVSKFTSWEYDTFHILPTIDIGISNRVNVSVFLVFSFWAFSAGVSFLIEE